MCRLAYIEHIAMGADYKQRQVVRKECGFAIIGPPFQKMLPLMSSLFQLIQISACSSPTEVSAV
jgi:hypothetical protein